MSTILVLYAFAAILPLGSAVAIFLGGKTLKDGAAKLATGVMGLSFVCCLIALLMWLPGDRKTLVANFPWLPLPGDGALYLGLMADSLTVAMMAMVSLIAFLVHIYSIGYMKGDKRYGRFFAYLSLFTFTMMGIVLSNSVMQLFVFWELVGLASYLLIGFWFEKRGPQLACKKAFVMNRVGDMGFLVGFGILFAQLGGNVLLPALSGTGMEAFGGDSMYEALTQALAHQSKAEGLTGAAAFSVQNPPMWLTIAGIGLFFGAMGKSAQFPLQTWLPDAMEGPTPVSSIVHSATMVAAGVYMTGRIYPILTPGAHLFIATIGLITLVIAALMALVMTDIKKVLAYSTLSQLGYMVLGLGTGAYIYAIFHLITHAFFKCCLFQCSGSVIHAAHHQQDMRYYGGLKDKMPLTCLCYFICTLAIAGASIPFTYLAVSGFYSKDGIIAGAYNYGSQWGGLGTLFYWGPTIVAFLTVFYMARSFALTFLGTPRDKKLYDHAHEAPTAMVAPQLVLAVFAVVAGWGWFVFKPLILDTANAMVEMTGGVESTLLQVEDKDFHSHSDGMHFVHAALLQGFGWIIALGAGIFLYKDGLGKAAKIAALPGFKQLHNLFINKFYFDALFDVFAVWATKIVAVIVAAFDKFIVDNIVNLMGVLAKGFAALSRSIDTRIVDGSVNGAASFAQTCGSVLRTTQAGRVRGYVLLMFASAALATLIVVTVVVATN